MNNFAPQGSYQMPSNQNKPWFSSYGDTRGSQDYYVHAQNAPNFFQQPPSFVNEPVKRYQATYGGGL